MDSKVNLILFIKVVMKNHQLIKNVLMNLEKSRYCFYVKIYISFLFLQSGLCFSCENSVAQNSIRGIKAGTQISDMYGSYHRDFLTTPLASR